MNRIFTILSMAGMIAMSACNDSNIIPPVVDSTDDDRNYQFDVTMSVTDDPVYDHYLTESTIFMTNVSYPDSSWNMALSDFFSSAGTPSAGAQITIMNDGNFSFSFTHQSNIGGYVDDVIGSGFFNADTLYFSYSYQEQESGNSGYVEVWSH